MKVALQALAAILLAAGLAQAIDQGQVRSRLAEWVRATERDQLTRGLTDYVRDGFSALQVLSERDADRLQLVICRGETVLEKQPGVLAESAAPPEELCRGKLGSGFDASVSRHELIRLGEGLTMRARVERDWLTLEFVLILAAITAGWAAVSVSRKLRLLEKERSERPLRQDAAVGRLAVQVAHDLKVPLAALKTLEHAKGIPAELAELLTGVIERLKSQIEKLMREAKVDPPGDVVFFTREAFERWAKRYSVVHPGALSLRLGLGSNPAIPPLGREASAEFEAILSNLTDNALESQTRAQESAPIRVDVRERGSKIVVEIEDRGVGFSREILASGGSRGQSMRAEGHGLGLSSAREWIEKRGGRFSIENTVRGARVTLET